MAVKAVLFDFWGTIVENGVFPSPLRQVKRILGIEGEFSDYVQRFEEVFMLKTWKDLNEAFTEVSKAFGITPTEEQLETLVGLWNRNKLFAKPYVETKDVLSALKERYTLILVSNTDCFSVEQVMEKYQLKDFFADSLLSYKLGFLKSDKRMFELALKKASASKDEAVMVGDSMESDIASAEAAGIRAVLVDRRDRRDYPVKIRNLRELPGLLEGM